MLNWFKSLFLKPNLMQEGRSHCYGLAGGGSSEAHSIERELLLEITHSGVLKVYFFGKLPLELDIPNSSASAKRTAKLICHSFGLDPKTKDIDVGADWDFDCGRARNLSVKIEKALKSHIVIKKSS